MIELANLETTVSGKITEVTNNGGFYYNIVIVPAIDAYSFPSFLKIRSKKTIGRVGDEIADLHCRVSGYKRTFEYTNKQTQQREKGTNYEQILEHVIN